jgi:hypothetical protein
MENENINYNSIEPQIFSIPKKTELKDFDNYKVMNEPVTNIAKKPIISSGFAKQPIREYSNEPNTNQSNPSNPSNQSNPSDDVNKISIAIKKLFNDLNIKEGILKVFGTEKIIVISILAVIRIWVKNTFPSLNQLLFKEKYSSLVIGYTHYTSSYYTSQNNEADSLLYKSILYYVTKNNVIGVKYVLNTAGIISHFDKNVEIRINKKIYIDTKVVISSTATVYEIELYSFSVKQDKLKGFLNKCIDTYKKYLMNTTNYTVGINSNQKFYSYQIFNNQTNSIIYEENKFFSNKTFDNIFFENKDTFMKKISYFCNNRGAYRELGIPYSLGIILDGPPGTGKTSLIKALANQTGRCVIDINLSKLKFQKELKAVFIEQKINNVEIPQDKRLYVFEEFDCMMDIVAQRSHESNNKHNNSDNKNSQKVVITETKYDEYYMPVKTTKEEPVQLEPNAPITLDTLLNCIDGTLEANGHMICLTTNYKEKIDKALLRPGRFDCHIHLDNATPKTILQMVNHFYNKNKDKVKEKDFIENYTDVLDVLKQYCYYNSKLVWSPAKITQICLTYMDDPFYLDKIIEHIKENYEEESKILEYFKK